MKRRWYTTGRKFRNIAFWFLLVVSVILFLFSLLSGAGEGFSGLLKNAPNALPWLVLLIITIIGYKHQLVSGGLLLVFAVGLLFLFDNLTTIQSKIVLASLEILVLLPAVLFILSGVSLKRKKNKNE